MQHTSPEPPSANRNYVLLFGADALLVAAVLGIHFLTPASEATTLAAYIGVIAAGLFVVVPFLLDLLRSRGDTAGAVEMRHEIADNQRILQDDIRALADTVLKRIAALEKHLHAHPANPANPPALGEMADQLASLSTLTGEDGDIPRLRTAIEEIQAQLDLFADAIRNLETTLRETPPPAEPEPDGPLPASLLAKAFGSGQPSGGAVARLIGNATRRDDTASPVVTPDTPVEDDLWHAAADMANEEASRPDDASPHSLFPKTTPAPEDESQSTLTFDSSATTGAAEVADDTAEAFSDFDDPEDNENDPDPSTQETPPAQADLLGELGLPPEAPHSHRTPAKNETALIANVMIGIGNKPFVRGTGPGLSEDIGAPMEYIAIGRWRWISPDPAQPARVTLWKNDIHRAEGGAIDLIPGSTVETNPAFPGD